MYFEYGEKELAYLAMKDPKLGEAIEQIGMVKREVMPDLFTAIVYNIVGQQISSAALDTVWGRLEEKLNHEVTPDSILALSEEELQSVGISFRKVSYIRKFAGKVQDGSFSLEELKDLSDEEVINRLVTLDGIGRWTAEMLLIFSLQRPDVLSYGDLGIQRGMRMLYHHRNIDPKKFNKYKRRYSPYGTVAGLYLWEISGGAIPGMKDYKPKEKKPKVKGKQVNRK